ncbi:tail fiber domain-containing protein [Emticicia fontis]
MKKTLFALLFITTQVYSQSKVEAVVGSSESGAAIKGISSNATGIGGHFLNTGSGKALITSGALRFGGSNVGTIASGKFLKTINTDGDAQWADLFPADYFGSLNNNFLNLQNTSTTTGSSGIYVAINSTQDATAAFQGRASNVSPTGQTSAVIGINESTNENGYGVYGIHKGGGSGIYGKADAGKGVVGYSEAGIGMYGISFGSSENSIGVEGLSTEGKGVYGVTAFGYAVYGSTVASGTGGYFSSQTGYSLITGKGRVGIGLDTPKEILDINGRVRIRHTTNTSGIWMSNSTNSLDGADGAFYGMKSDTETGVYIGNAWRFWVNSAGNGYLGGNIILTSDKRLKKDFSRLNNSLTTITQLHGYHYKWIEESRNKDLQTGLIAQEVQQIFPELVQTDEKGFLSVNYIGLIPHLIEAVKELRQENSNLKNKNQSLESRLDKIEALLSAQQQQMETTKSK